MAKTSSARRQTTDEAILLELGDIARRLKLLNDERDALYAKRKRLFAAGRKRTPPIHQRVLGAAAGVSDIAVIATLRDKR